MPWKYGYRDNPNHYVWPDGLSDDVVLGRKIQIAMDKRKEVAQIREQLLATQRAIGRDDREGARYLSELASDMLKQYRGYDAAIKMITDAKFTEWPRPMIQEEIASYVDRAFDVMEYA